MTERSPPRKSAPEGDAPTARPTKGGKKARAGHHGRGRTLHSPPPPDAEEWFRCIHCGARIGPTVSGGRHRNHCPICLYSRHVDDTQPGDRASGCRGPMAPVGRFERPNGEPVILHRCTRCGFERYNRVAADDDWERYLALPVVPARHSGAPTEIASTDR